MTQPPLPHPRFGFIAYSRFSQCFSDRQGPRLLDHSLFQSYAIDIGKARASVTELAIVESAMGQESATRSGYKIR
jgi:hypothetical protein